MLSRYLYAEGYLGVRTNDAGQHPTALEQAHQQPCCSEHPGPMVAVHDVVGVAPPPQGLTRESISIAQHHVQQEQPVPGTTGITKPLGFSAD
ncbi:MAG: hypothetical protein FRX49_00964 [Trebouxia sp. A1-2]|nr:MAG: hypothetical protein FRX49_00964 [Trebouxia sp. A1-2]